MIVKEQPHAVFEERAMGREFFDERDSVFAFVVTEIENRDFEESMILVPFRDQVATKRSASSLIAIGKNRLQLK